MDILSWQSLDNVWPEPQSDDWHWEKVIHNPLHLTHEWIYSSIGLLLQQEV